MTHNKKHHLLQLLPSMQGGGVEQGCIDITEIMVKNGHQVSVMSNGGFMVPYLEKAGAQHIKMPIHRKSLLWLIINIFRVRRFCKNHNVTIIHARSRMPAWCGFFVAKLCHVHFITTFHGTYNFRTSLKKFYNSVMCRGHHVIAISYFIEEYIKKNYAHLKPNITVIARGFHPEKFDPDRVSDVKIAEIAEQNSIPLDKMILLMPGRYAHWKGQDLLIQAIEGLKDNVFAIFLGYSDKDIHQYYKYQKMAEKLGCREYCCFLPFDNQKIAHFYKLADIVVSASKEPEAFGRVTAEGQAMGRIVLAPNHGGALEQIEHDKNGYLFEANNVDDLKQHIIHIMNLPLQKRKKMMVNARRSALKNFTIDKMQTATLELYEQLSR